MKLFYFARIDIGYQEASARHVIEFCRQFVKLGHEVTLFVPDLGKRREVDGVSVVWVPVLSKRCAITFFSFYIFLFFFFLRFYFRDKPDVVYTRHQQMEWMVTWLRFVLDFNYVIEVNGLTVVEMKIHSIWSPIVFLTIWMERFTFRLPDLLVTPSSRIRDHLCREYNLSENKFLVVTNGADIDRFYPMDSMVCRKKLGLKSGGKYLIFVGSFKKWHGIAQIVKVFPTLVEKNPDIRLLLVGDGEERETIERIIQSNNLHEKVMILGMKPFDEIPVYINAADICLAPYFDELLDETGISPLKIFEYMACGKPVITRPVGGLGEVLRPHDAGLLLDTSDPGDWVSAIDALIDDPKLCKTYGDNGHNAVMNEFNWRSICERIGKTLESL